MKIISFRLTDEDIAAVTRYRESLPRTLEGDVVDQAKALRSLVRMGLEAAKGSGVGK